MLAITKIKNLTLLGLFLFCSFNVFSQNPFTTQQKTSNQGIINNQLGTLGGPAFIMEWSRTLQNKIATLSRAFQKEGNIKSAILAIFIAFIFGVVHVIGPGHGKTFAISYFSSVESRLSDAISYSAIVNLVDSISAFLMVYLGYTLLSKLLPAFRLEAPNILKVISYSLVILFGVSHLIHAFRHSGRHKHTHKEHSSHKSAELIADNKKTKSTPWLLAISVGLVPCPVSSILLIYGVVNNSLGIMLVLVAAVSAGGFVTMCGISISIVAGRKALLTSLEGKTARLVTGLLEYTSSTVIILFGGLLLLSTL